jgi:hypothetical protein
MFWHAFAQGADGRDNLQIQKEAENTLNKHCEVVDKGSSVSLGVY